MSVISSIQEYDRLKSLVRSAWMELNRAGDTPDSHRSIECLRAVLEAVEAADVALLGRLSPVDSLAVRYYQPLRTQQNAAELLKELEVRHDRLNGNDRTLSLLDTCDPSLINQAIPLLWCMIRTLDRDIRRSLSFRCRLALLLRSSRALIWILCAGICVQSVRFAMPGGALVAYYRGEDHSGVPAGWRVFSSLRMEFADGRPLPWISRANWSAQSRGVIAVPATDEYKFYAQCEGGMRMWIDDELLIDNWKSSGWSAGVRARKSLDAGPHSIRMQYRGLGGRFAARVRWTGGPIPPNTVLGGEYLRKY
jgi:hypothetical protein